MKEGGCFDGGMDVGWQLEKERERGEGGREG